MIFYKSDGTAYSTNLTQYDTRQDQRHVHYSDLAAGTYIVKVLVNGWLTNDVKDYTLRVYGNVDTTIKLMDTASITTFNTNIMSTVIAAGTSGLS
jgi:hypothetical protein